MPAALLVSKSPPLCGELTVHGAKNSVLPILAATLLCRTPCVLHHCPDILDVTHTLQILRHLGCSCERSGSTLSIDPRGFAENAVQAGLVDGNGDPVDNGGILDNAMTAAGFTYADGWYILSPEETAP